MPAAPRATYRVQLHAKFGFEETTALASYLNELGVSHIYCSPYLQAQPGSTHGYDVVDYRHVNSELGGAEKHARMCTALRDHQVGQILDIVPNHMAIGGWQNPWWWDVLENGQSSNYAAYFDVDWDPPEARLRNSVLLPVLGRQYGRALEAGEIQLAREEARFEIRYYDRKFPAAPRALDKILGTAAVRCGSDELEFLADSLSQLPLATATDRISVRRRHRDKAVIAQLLWKLLEKDPEVGKAIDDTIAEINLDHAALHAFLERQNFRLAYWRAAGRDLGYRRFFDINTLVGLRMEDGNVFADTHALVLKWLREGILDGVRVDHIDGLRDPEQYLHRLRRRAPDAYIVVEKILERGEPLPARWPIEGTTGYDFLNIAGGLFIDPAGEEPFTRFYAEFTGEPADFAAVARDKKGLIMREVLGSDLNRLTAMFVDICEQQPNYRDYTRHELHEALIAVVTEIPVYRTYLREDGDAPSAADRGYITGAIAQAKAARPDLDPDLLDFLGRILSVDVRGNLEIEMAMRFQQFTGPVMAKAVEDTAFYCFNRFVSLNEVGGDPGRFGASPNEFHQWCRAISERWPRTMLSTDTHDTKRSGDVRARLNLLSEIPHEWESAVRRWSAHNQRYWEGGAPDRNAEYLLYQTLAGCWPIEQERILRYMEKATREAKQHTSWTNPNSDYENGLSRFVEGIMNDRAFSADMDKFVSALIEPGRINSLAQTLLKLTAPGIPDIYQGTELWQLSLVDPDNRGPVDYQIRRRLLQELHGATVEEIMRRSEDGLPKLWLIRQALGVRAQFADAFEADGTFESLRVSGERASHVIAFVRGGSTMSIVPRLVLKLAGEWRDTAVELPPGRWRNALTSDHFDGGPTQVDVLLARFPVALLTREIDHEHNTRMGAQAVVN